MLNYVLKQNRRTQSDKPKYFMKPKWKKRKKWVSLSLFKFKMVWHSYHNHQYLKKKIIISRKGWLSLFLKIRFQLFMCNFSYSKQFACCFSVSKSQSQLHYLKFLQELLEKFFLFDVQYRYFLKACSTYKTVWMVLSYGLCTRNSVSSGGSEKKILKGRMTRTV